MRGIRLGTATTVACLWALCTAAPLQASGTAGYRILARYAQPRGAIIMGIAVDSAARRIFVAEGNGIRVLNADTGVPVGEIPVRDVRGIVLDPGEQRGFATSGAGDSVAMFDSGSLKVLKTIPLAGRLPASMAYVPGAGRLFVVEAGSGAVVAIDAKMRHVISTLQLAGSLGPVAANGYGELFVAADGPDAIHVVDTQTLKFVGDFPVGAGCRPSALALDRYGRRLFVACRDGRLQIIDTDIGFTFQTLPIGTGDAGEVFTFKPQGPGGWRGATFVVSSDGTLTLVRMDAFIHYSEAGRLKLERGIRSIAYDAKTHHLLVPSGSALLVIGQ